MQQTNVKTNFSCELIVNEKKIGAVGFEIDDFESIFKMLELQAGKAVELEILAINKEYTEAKKSADHIIKGMRESTSIWVVLTTTENTVKHVTDFSELEGRQDLKKQGLKKIKSIKYSVICPYFRTVFVNRNMKNIFELNLDFSSIDLFDFSNLYLFPTPNQSNYRIFGDDSNWVNGVSKNLDDFFKERSLKRDWLYKRHTYNLFLIIFAYPISVLSVYSINKYFLSNLNWPPIVLVGVYVYVFFVALFLMRILFNFCRWLFPPMEIIGMNKGIQKWRGLIMFLITGGILSPALSSMYTGVQAFFVR